MISFQDAQRSDAKAVAWLIGAFLLTLPLINPYVRGDGNGYYAYVRSAVIDQDLQFENEFRHGDPAFLGFVFDDRMQVRPELATSTHHVRNQWAVGPSLLWAPFFLIAHGMVESLNHLGWNIPADGYSLPYLWSCALGTALYAFIGLLLSYWAAQQFTTGPSALLATVGIWFASSLPVYMYFLPFHVHALAAFTVSLFLWYWLRTRPQRTLKQWGLWGLMGGLVAEVYYLNMIFLLIPLFDMGKSGARAGEAKNILAFSAAVLLALMPHFAVKWIIHGSPFDTGYRDQFFLDSPRLWQVAFSSEHGMFLWTPVLLLAVAGLLFLWRQYRMVAAPLLTVFVVFYYAVASYQNWHGISAFGNRFFVSFTPVFVLGLAICLQEAGRALSGFRARLVPALLLAGLVLWNVGFMFQWGTNLVPNRGPVALAEVARNQVTVVPKRIGGFLVRYLASRQQVDREIELEDLNDWKQYRQER